MRLFVIMPCYFDVPLFQRVCQEVRAEIKKLAQFSETRFVLIDDSAGQDAAVDGLHESDVEVLRVPYNMGHQAALVFGLRRIGTQIQETDYVLTMDSDGEDRPSDIAKLLTPLLQKPKHLHSITVARRTERQEALVFKLMYFSFKSLFWVLTGTVIRSGNFVAYRGWFLKEVIFHPHFDQCYASSFMSLPLQIHLEPLPRGLRFGGKSKMGYMGLVTHGIRMLMPFSERIAIRGMIGVGLLMVLTTVLFVVSCCSLVWGAVFMFLLTWLGIFALLFATFSQTKSRSLRSIVPKS